MIRKIKYLPFLLLLYGCPINDEGMKTNYFHLDNRSNQNMKVNIYERSSGNTLSATPSFLEPNIPFGHECDNENLRLAEDYVPLNRVGDSAVIVLGDRYLIHKYDQVDKVFTPNENNIFRISSYTQETPTIYRMELNQEDYDNATPCNDDPICGE
jgi:hypothetical protein